MATPQSTTVTKGRFHLTPSMPDIVAYPPWLYSRAPQYLAVCHKDLPSIRDNGFYHYPYAISVFNQPSQRLVAFITLETSKEMTNVFCMFDSSTNKDDEDIVRHVNFDVTIDETLSSEQIWNEFQWRASEVLKLMYDSSELNWRQAS